MSRHASITGAIDKGPSGPRIGAFFDLDRTLIAGFSASAFVRELVRLGKIDAAAMVQGAAAATRFRLGGVGFSAFVAETVGLLRGMPERELVEMGERLFAEGLATAIYPESRALVEAHQRKGHTVAVVSSALPYQVDPIACELGIRHVMCTRLAIAADGTITGEVQHPSCYGVGKATAARDFAAAHGIELSRSFFYTDSEEDLPLLDLVGRPRPINPSRALSAIAAKRGWPARRFTSRGAPQPREVLRTALAAASAVPSFLLSLPAALLTGDWRQGVNLGLSTWGELGTAIAGVDLQVQGEQYLWSHRPAVFVFNHQSAVETLLLCKLLRRDFVGIAKKELQRTPLFGPLFAAGGTIFVDRFNHQQAVKALAPAIDALRRGLSIVIAPEGTRSPTPRLGQFKKGAFHLAMAAQRPIVPIVFRNTLDVLPKHGTILRPATVEVVVHKPIPTTGWTRRSLDRRVEEVHRLFAHTLEERKA
jgi:putative phosphoserine phosphatase/1-acylglycerol-3-phosphate O-acyltransferase